MRPGMWLLVALVGLSWQSPAAGQGTPVGLARVDITPDYPVRLAGFGFRRAESEGVTQRIWAKALVIGQDEPVVLLALDACGVSQEFTEEVAGRLREKLKLPRERFALTVTHTHTAPLIAGYLPTLFGQPIPAEHQKHIEQYTRELKDKLVEVAEAAWRDRQPAKLSWGMGTVKFAMNRRTPGGPVDHDLPLLAIHNTAGKLRGVWVNYACHCVTLSNNKISGDWAGYAAELVEAEHPGALALVSIGCGADSNPDSGVTGEKVELARKQGGFLAAEVKRLLGGFLAPVSGLIAAKYSTFELPLAPPPSRDELTKRAQRNDAIGYHARVQLERLARGEKLPAKVPYSVQTWSFGESLAMVFLPGEVVVDYALRLKRELHGQRLWVNAYANHVPCYIPSERILKEGRYEGVDAMTYYNLPGPFAAGLEEKIVGAVKRQLEPTFKPPYDANKLGGGLPLSPQQSAALLQVRPGLTAELMVAEPLVQAPVAISFGPDGKLWVAEMRDYPHAPDGQPGGCVRLLESTRGDWRYDKSTVFLDKIPFPTGVTAWRRGVLVCAAPDILYAEDTNGDGRADVVKKLFSGFGTGNFQARVNSLEYGLDGWVYGSCGLFGGNIKSFNGKTYALGNRDFRIKPDTGELEPATGQTQQGRVRDDYGHWFGCDNSVLARHYVLPDHALRRHAAVKPPPAGVFVATGPQAHRLFPLRPQVQLFELSGPPGLPTAACGIGVYRDDLLGSDLTGNLFTCEPVNLVVHRLVLEQKGASFAGKRAADEANREFLASTDNWFRPVQVRTGPDGCLWVVDMHRLVIEHPIWIPPADLAKLDVRAGSTMGRIFRIRPSDQPVRPMQRLDQMSSEALVQAIDTPNGTVRDLVMQEFVWRGQPFDDLKLKMLTFEATPAVVVSALCTLHQLGRLDAEILRPALLHADERVCRAAVRLAAHYVAKSEGIRTDVLRSLARRDISKALAVEYALTLGEFPDDNTGAMLTTMLLGVEEDPYVTAAVLCSLRPGFRLSFLDGIYNGIHVMQKRPGLAVQVLAAVVHEMDDATIVQVLQGLTPTSKDAAAWQFDAIAGALQQHRFTKLPAGALTNLYAMARTVAAEDTRPQEVRVAAASVLLGPGQTPEEWGQSRQLLLTFLAASQTPALQQVAVRTLGRHFDAATADAVCRRWMSFAPATRAGLVDLLMSRRDGQRRLLEAVVSRNEIPASHLDASTKQSLLTHRDNALRTLALQAFPPTSADRVGLLTQYASHANGRGDAAQGKLVFHRVCAACHQVGGQGHAVGPDLAALANRTAGFLLQEILDPNRNLDSRYIEYVAVTKQGRTVTGVLASESANSVLLRGKEGRDETLLRSELEELQATGKSLMPEGLEKEITPAQMNDLLAYVGTLNRAAKSFAGNAPATIEPVNDVLTLPATRAEIHGDQIVFEPPYQNVGYWHGLNDYVLWTATVPRAGVYDVYLDWACANESAGNRYRVEIGAAALAGEVAGTGGWSQYLRVRVGQIRLEAGLQQVKVRPDGPVLKGALMDLRTVYIAPAEHRLNLQEETSRRKPDYAALAMQLLDDKTPNRPALIEQYAAHAAELITAMTADLPNDAKEEYRRIPWIWRVAIFAGRKNDAATLRRLLDVSMPQEGQPLRDWQAVVLGGGVVNGISQLDLWPAERVKELLKEPALEQRWRRVIELSHAMSDYEKVPAGTRYDALRIVALDEPSKAIERLKKYLPAGGNEELQMGAVSGLVDVQATETEKLLAAALGHLKGENLRLAIDGLLRTPERAAQLAGALEAGNVKAAAVDMHHRRKIQERAPRWPAELRQRMDKVLGKG